MPAVKHHFRKGAFSLLAAPSGNHIVDPALDAFSSDVASLFQWKSKTMKIGERLGVYVVRLNKQRMCQHLVQPIGEVIAGDSVLHGIRHEAEYPNADVNIVRLTACC